MNTVSLATLMVVLASIGQYVAEWVFGRKYSGDTMKAIALVITMGLFVVTWGVAKVPSISGGSLDFLAGMALLPALGAALGTGVISSAIHKFLPGGSTRTPGPPPTDAAA